jgi:hypothetical protein
MVISLAVQIGENGFRIPVNTSGAILFPLAPARTINTFKRFSFFQWGI